MSAILSELASIAFFVIVGWASLWPMRSHLGPVSYHLAALPFGLLASPLAVAVSALTGHRVDVPVAIAGGVLLVVAMWILQILVLEREDRGKAPVGLRSFLVAAAALGSASAALAFVRFTVTNNDSFVSYWPLGVALNRFGAITTQLVGARSALIPGMNAIHAAFGSDWAYVIYPMLGLSLAAWLVTTLWSGPLAAASRKVKWLVAGGAGLFLAIEPSYLFQSLFVHSHMFSAIYLIMAVTCVALSLRPDDAGAGLRPRAAFLALAGGFTAGLMLARPDGLAYGFVPVAIAIAVLTVGTVDRREVAAFFAPLLFIVMSAYSAGYVRLGMWTSPKLSGRLALLILAVVALSAAGPWIVQALDRRLPFRVAGERFIGLLVAVAGVLGLAVLALKFGTAVAAFSTAGKNLFAGHGGYSYLWYAVVAVLVLSALTHDALRAGSWTRSPFLAIALFLIIAALIHGTSHPGRLGAGDSLNRVMFHVFPLAVWYAGAVVARILGTATSAPERAGDGTAVEVEPV